MLKRSTRLLVSRVALLAWDTPEFALSAIMHAAKAIPFDDERAGCRSAPIAYWRCHAVVR